MQTENIFDIFDTIVFHSPCSDGTAGAWAIWRENRSATLVPAKHGMKLSPETYQNKRVAIVDFSFPREYLKEICSEARRVVLLDHHKSAERDLNGLEIPNLEIYFDMKRSGAQLAWDYMYGTLFSTTRSYLFLNMPVTSMCNLKEEVEKSLGKQLPAMNFGFKNRNGELRLPYRPWFTEAVADRDLWKWELEWSKAVGKATLFLGYHDTVEKVEELVMSGKRFTDFIEFGNLLLKKDAQLVEDYSREEKFCQCTMKLPSGEYKVAVCSPPFYLRSEIGNNIATRFPVDFVVMYTYNFPSDEYWLSLRASDTSKADVSLIAKELPNGGGHAKASGATIYGPNSFPPEEAKHRKGETMHTYLTKIPREMPSINIEA